MRHIVLDRVAEHFFIGSWLEADTTIVDLGMNVGDFAYAVQRKYNCRIVGVEANPALARKIRSSDRLTCFKPRHRRIERAGRFFS